MLLLMLCLCKNDFLNKKFPYPPHESLQRLNPHHTPNLYIGRNKAEEVSYWVGHDKWQLSLHTRTKPGDQVPTLSLLRMREYPINEHVCGRRRWLGFPTYLYWAVFFINNYPLFYPIFFCFANYWQWYYSCAFTFSKKVKVLPPLELIFQQT